MKWKKYPDEKPSEKPAKYLTCTLNGSVTIKFWTNPVHVIAQDGREYDDEYRQLDDRTRTFGRKEEYKGWGFYNTKAGGRNKTVVCWTELPEPPEYCNTRKNAATSAYIAEIERLRKMVEELQRAASGKA